MGVVAAVLKKIEESVARNATQTKALPNLCCGGRLKRANVRGQSGSPCFLSVSQLRNGITNRSITCAVPGKFSSHLPRTSSAFPQQHNVPPSNVQKKSILRKETLQTQTSLSRLPPPSFRRGELLGHNSGRHSPKSVPSLRRTQPANSPSLIAQTISREKNQGPIKSFGATLQAFVLYKKRATNVNLCSLDDGIPVHEKINVAALSPLHLSDAFDALEEYFCAFPQASLFVLTLQPLQKYSEKIIWTSFSPTHRTVTQPSPLKRRLCPSIVVSSTPTSFTQTFLLSFAFATVASQKTGTISITFLQWHQHCTAHNPTDQNGAQQHLQNRPTFA